MAVANLRVAAEREDFQAFGGDDLAPGDQQQPCVPITLGHQALRFAGSVERPDVAGGVSGRVAKSPKVVHARRLGEQQPTRILGRRPASARGTPEIGERAVEETITVEIRVIVDMAVDQEPPADDVATGRPAARRPGPRPRDGTMKLPARDHLGACRGQDVTPAVVRRTHRTRARPAHACPRSSQRSPRV